MTAKKTNLHAAFCGTGKSYLCNSSKIYAEVECWEYRKGDFPNNYVGDIISKLGSVEYLFISTDPIVLKRLNEMGYTINLYYPENNLKKEYFKRYVERSSHIDFMRAYSEHWGKWLSELKEQDYCNHIILSEGEYLQDVLIRDE